MTPLVRGGTDGPSPQACGGLCVIPWIWAQRGWCCRSLPRGAGGEGGPHHRSDTALALGVLPSQRQGRSQPPAPQLSPVTSRGSDSPNLLPPRLPTVLRIGGTHRCRGPVSTSPDNHSCNACGRASLEALHTGSLLTQPRVIIPTSQMGKLRHGKVK